MHRFFQAPIFNLGFRIFFASAAVYGAIAMLLWMAFYTFGLGADLPGHVLPQYWHGHEMVFGYAGAAIAGFLLTAVGNWTGQAMPAGHDLFAVWLPWLAARLIFVLAPQWAVAGIVLNIAFYIVLFFAVFRPIYAVRQWRQMGILAKIVLMAVADILCFCGALGWFAGWHYGLYLGVFSIVGLLLTIGRRVTPFFISRGVGYPFEPKNSALLDRLCLASFLAFFFLQLFSPWQWAASMCALVAAGANGWRLAGWYTKGIWKKPLLWSMFLSLSFVVLGLFLYFLLWPLAGKFSPSIAMHAMAAGGMGVMILSMMARVSLGHTGRNIHQPPRTVPWALAAVAAAAVLRTVFPLCLPKQYLLWIGLAQGLWAAAFLLLAVSYLPIWSAPRVDGKAG